MNYEEIQKVYRLEKNTPTLTEIPKNFFAEAGSLIESLEEKHRDSISRFFGEIIGNRRRKILLHALRTEDEKLPPTNATPDEVEFHTELVGVLARHKSRLLSQKTPQPPQALVEEKKTVSVRILRALPAMAGSGAETFGPFREGDVAELPLESAGILITQGAAEKIGV